MKISELAETTGVPTATVKFYLRRRLLHPGTALSRTLAEYDDGHVARIRLIRALTEVGGLDLASVSRVLATLDGNADDRLGILAAAQRAVSGDPLPARDDEPDPGTARTRAWLAARGWRIDPADPQVGRLEDAWRACDLAGIGLTGARMDTYADAVEEIARVDVETVPREPEAAVRQVVLGTVLVEPLLRALRRLAHQDLSTRRETSDARTGESPARPR